MEEITVIGRLGRDAELKTGKSGKPYGFASMYASQKTGNKTPEGKDEYESTWYSFFCEPEEVPMLKKGLTIMVKGVPKYGIYTPKNGGEPKLDLRIAFTEIFVKTKSLGFMMDMKQNGTPMKKGEIDYATLEDNQKRQYEQALQQQQKQQAQQPQPQQPPMVPSGGFSGLNSDYPSAFDGTPF